MARRKHSEEHENHERWLVSYADFITLLFAFFVVLYATSQKDSKKEKEFEQSIRKYLVTMAAVGVGGGAGAGAPGAAPSLENPLRQELLEKFPPAAAGPAEVQDVVQRLLDKRLSGEQQQSVQGVRHDSIGVRITLASSALFDSGSAQLRKEAYGVLRKVGEIVKESERRLIIEGHTDNVPIQSDFYASNWDLASARAVRVVRYLEQAHQVPSQDMVAVSYGAHKPKGTNDTQEGRAHNRRIEILIVTGGSSL